MSWFYMSFADPDRPKGTQFLGGCYVEAETLEEAMTVSHLRGINPGGEVELLGPIPDEKLDEAVPASDRWRLLTREEIG